jgi:hypothetical protein
VNCHIRFILCIYDGISQEWDITELESVLKWLYGLTSIDNCRQALQLAWMKPLDAVEKRRLGLLRDFYIGQIDGRVKPLVDLRKAYAQIVKHGRFVDGSFINNGARKG